MTEIGPGCRQVGTACHPLPRRKVRDERGMLYVGHQPQKGLPIGLPQKTAILTRRSDWPNGPAARSSQRCAWSTGRYAASSIWPAAGPGQIDTANTGSLESTTGRLGPLNYAGRLITPEAHRHLPHAPANSKQSRTRQRRSVGIGTPNFRHGPARGSLYVVYLRARCGCAQAGARIGPITVVRGGAA